MVILQVFLVLTILFISISFGTPIVNGENLENGKIAFTIKYANSITSDTAPQNATFAIHIVIQQNFNFPKINSASPVIQVMREGTLSFPLQGQEPLNASVYDSLGNQYPFAVGITNDTIMNTRFDFNAPQNSNFSFYLSFDTLISAISDNNKTLNNLYNIIFINKTANYVFGFFSLNSGQYSALTVNLPIDFTVFYDNSTSSTIQNEKSQLFSWNLKKGQLTDAAIGFFPFPLAILQSEQDSLDVTNIFPVRDSHIATFNEVIISTAKFGGYELEPISEFPVQFPIPFSKFTINRVYDGEGECEPILFPLTEASNDSGGFYFLNSTQNTLIIYPHNIRIEDHYYYNTTIVYEFSTDSNQETTTSPYTYQYHFNIQNPNESGWDFSNALLSINCLLPLGTNHIQAQGNPLTTTVDGRTQVSWNNIPLQSATLTVKFDVSSLFQFFWLSMAVLLALMGLVVLSIKSLNPDKNNFLKIDPLAILTCLGAQYGLLINLGGFPFFVVILFAIEIALGFASFLILYRKHKRRSNVV